ncbi:MAG TPA: helix-turn-helix transcriptional regulator [Terriglobales bacterium]|nr:helix-turn-helix transcriptional regulator [Terriglobales bacterium]
MSANRTNQTGVATDEKIRLAELLKQAREYLSLSQDEVAKAVGIARAAISLIESGQRRVDALELKKFAAVYQRPVSYFTGDEVAEATLPSEVEHLARAAANLSSKDREELARFAEFLQSRATVEHKTK